MAPAGGVFAPRRSCHHRNGGAAKWLRCQRWPTAEFRQTLDFRADGAGHEPTDLRAGAPGRVRQLRGEMRSQQRHMLVQRVPFLQRVRLLHLLHAAIDRWQGVCGGR